MKTLDHNAIHRSLHSMTFRLQERQQAKRKETGHYDLAETLQQFQMAIQGNAGQDDYSEVTINFPETIYYAPLQRASNRNEDPQFTWGIQLDSGDAHFSVHVTGWQLDADANYTGATIRVHAMQPKWFRGKVPSPYSGTLHCTFQGLSVPVEDPGYDENP
jgi:hypothetical protein